MSLVSLICALLLEQWRPLAERRAVFSPVERYADFLERQFNAGEAQHGVIAWLVAVLPPVLGAWLLYLLCAWISPLLALAPYIARYRWRAILALISLTVAAITTLVVPIAVRRMIDFGFTPTGIAMINSYFSVMIAVVAVLALGVGVVAQRVEADLVLAVGLGRAVLRRLAEGPARLVVGPEVQLDGAAAAAAAATHGS